MTKSQSTAVDVIHSDFFFFFTEWKSENEGKKGNKKKYVKWNEMKDKRLTMGFVLEALKGTWHTRYGWISWLNQGSFILSTDALSLSHCQIDSCYPNGEWLVVCIFQSGFTIFSRRLTTRATDDWLTICSCQLYHSFLLHINHPSDIKTLQSTNLQI